jgi:histidinol-phosphate/aromatic aminotransferase/cobyric acid decarboxylase-like protein
MALAFEHVDINDDIVLIESDLIYQPNVIARLLHSKEKNVALVDQYHRGMDGTVVTVKNGIVTSVIPPHLQDDKFDFSNKYKTLNIYKFSKDFCNNTFKKLLTYYAKAINDNCYYELILGMLIYMQQDTVHAEILDGEKWAEVDDPNDLRIAEFVFNDNARPQILENGFGGYWNYDITDFAFIRNMYFPNKSIISEMRNSLPELLYNYGSRQTVLDEKLARFLLCKKEYVHALGGAGQIYPMLGAYCAGKKTLVPCPTFGEYTRIFPQAITYGDCVGINTDEIMKQAQGCSVVVFVNPNNPTASMISTQWIADFSLANPDKLVIVDESFIEFADTQSILHLCEQKNIKNVIIIKSLSKSLGMPGLRLGYVFSCNTGFMKYVGQSIPIWNMNSLAEFFLEIVLKHRNSLSQSFIDTKKDREEFRSLLAAIPFVDQVFTSHANFILIRLKPMDITGEDIVDAMLAKYSLYIKDCSKKFHDNRIYIRLAVRLPQENARLVSALANVIPGGKCAQ